MDAVSHLSNNPRKVVLVSGLWKYDDVDEKKSLGKLNVIYNKGLREELLSIVGAGSIYAVGYNDNGIVQPLFKSNEEIEPTLVSVALGALIPRGFEVSEVSLADLLDPAVVACVQQKHRLTGDEICLLSTSYITNFFDFERVIKTLQGLGIRFIICGGYLATRNPDACLHRGADAVVIGDAEEALPMLLERIDSAASWSFIPNLRYRNGDGEPVFTREKLMELDQIPVAIPDGDLSSMSIPYESMRGCPYRCGFCSYPLVSTKWRYKSAEKLTTDFLTIQERGAHNIVALDSTFTIPPKRLKEFLNLYIEKNITIPWGAYSRVTPLKDEEIVKKLKRTNNRWLSIGFESGSDRMLQIMKKGTKMRDAYPALKNLKKHKISPWSNFIIGYPGETKETVEETVSFMKEHLFGFYGIYVFNIRDRAMPVLSDSFANIHYDDIGGEWAHVSMNSRQATVLRWKAYLNVAASNQHAINIDIFRGTNVEKDYGAWSPAFPALKAIELFMVWHTSQDEIKNNHGMSYSAIRQQLQQTLFPMN